MVIAAMGLLQNRRRSPYTITAKDPTQISMIYTHSISVVMYSPVNVYAFRDCQESDSAFRASHAFMEEEKHTFIKTIGIRVQLRGNRRMDMPRCCSLREQFGLLGL
jgi:hypothetical protein